MAPPSAVCFGGRALLLCTALLFLGAAVTSADMAPFGPGDGALFRPAKPAGFGKAGVQVQEPAVNGSKVLPYDLTECNADNCLMCDQYDKDVCVMCDGASDAPWRSVDGACVDACASGDVKIKTAERGLWCIHCLSADERECGQYCTGYRWDATSSNCTTACQLPASFGRNTAPGTCTAGTELAGSGSCTVECANGATASVADSLTYTCASNSNSMELPEAVCETIWDQVSVGGTDLGEVYRELLEDWEEAADCADVASRAVTASSYQVVDNALAALGLPNSSHFTLACDAAAAFPADPRFTLKAGATDAFELVSSKLTLVGPVLHFSKPDGAWRAVLLSASAFTLPDNGTEINTETFGLFTAGGANGEHEWELRTGALDTWAEPFGLAWLENHGVIAGHTARGGTANETLTMWSRASLAMASVEATGTFTYTYGAAADPHVMKFELDDADIHTVIGLVQDLESLPFKPVALRDFYLTEPLAVVWSDTAGVYVDEAWGVVGQGLTFGTTLKLDSDARLHNSLRCLGAAYKYYYLRFFVGDSDPDSLTVVHTQAFDVNSAWSVANVTMDASWSSTDFYFNASAPLHMAMSKGSFDFPVMLRYDGTSDPMLMADVAEVTDTLGFIGVDVAGVHATFEFDDWTGVCSVFLTGKLEFPGVGALPMRGVVHSSAPHHGYWAATSPTDGVSLGVDIVPWWNAVWPDLAIDDADNLEAMVLDNTEITISSANTDGVAFPTTDSGSKTRSRTFARGWIMTGTHTHLEVDGMAAEFKYTATTNAQAGLEVVFDSAAADDIVDGRKATYLASYDGDFAAPQNDAITSEDLQWNLSIALQKDPMRWADLELTPVVQTVVIPEVELAAFAGAGTAAQQVVLVDMVVVWAGDTYEFVVPVEFADVEGDYVGVFIASLAFDCVQNVDCSAGEKCRHVITAGRVNATEVSPTWHCVDACRADEEFAAAGDLGCFENYGLGDQCREDRPCGANYCVNGACLPRYENGEACTLANPDYCFSGFCCWGCGLTCQDYPLAPGFNCSLGLEHPECASGWCSSEEGDLDAEAVCLALIEDGDACNEDRHCESGYCSAEQSDVCVTQYNETGPCYLDDDCFGNFTCCWECGFECQAYPRGLGLSCVKDDDCDSASCSSVTFTCSEPRVDGEACAADDGCISEYCSLDRGECFTLLDDDETCTYDSDCTSAHCSADRGVCFEKLADGDSCVHDSDCDSDWCTSRGAAYSGTTAATATCQTRYARGETCSENEECDSLDCSADCTWFVCACA